MKRTVFFLGKGGVGKTTLAGSFSIYISERKERVFLASLDPAHNLFDLFGTKPEKGVRRFTENLYIQEIDHKGRIRNLLKETSQRMKQTYRYLQIINLESMFDVLKHSPGMEEYAMLSALNEIIAKWTVEVDYIVIDTPPTGLSLRLFSLPVTTRVWIEQLMKLRKRILDRRSQIAHIKGREAFGEDVATEPEDDQVIKELNRQYEVAKRTEQLLADRENCKRVLVLNYDKLSVKEGIMIIHDLKELGIPIDLIIFNKTGLTKASRSLLDEFYREAKETETVEIPFFRDAPTTIESLKEIAGYFADKLCK